MRAWNRKRKPKGHSKTKYKIVAFYKFEYSDKKPESIHAFCRVRNSRNKIIRISHSILFDRRKNN